MPVPSSCVRLSGPALRPFHARRGATQELAGPAIFESGRSRFIGAQATRLLVALGNRVSRVTARSLSKPRQAYSGAEPSLATSSKRVTPSCSSCVSSARAPLWRSRAAGLRERWPQRESLRPGLWGTCGREAGVEEGEGARGKSMAGAFDDIRARRGPDRPPRRRQPASRRSGRGPPHTPPDARLPSDRRRSASSPQDIG